MKPINLRIAEELGVREQQAAAAISLLDGGATVPFVARYRKEATGALDDAQLRALDERLRYLRELDERRAAKPTVPLALPVCFHPHQLAICRHLLIGATADFTRSE